MKLKTTLKRVYLPALIGIILLSVSFRVSALFTNFNSETGFFDGKILINIASAIVTAGSIFMFTYAFRGSKKYKLIADFSTPATYVPTGVLSVAMIFFAALSWIQKRNSGFSIKGFMALPNSSVQGLFKYIASNMAGFVLTLIVPLACLSVGYFILNACVLERASTARAFFGITNVLFLAFYASFLYFDTATLARNAPNKIVDQMAFLFAALFFLYEIRISLGREKWNLYIAFGFIAALLTAYSSIPSLILYFVSGSTVSNNIQENVLSFALLVFIISRIILAAFLKEDCESESISAIKEYSKERADYIFSKEEAARKAYLELYANLNEISDTDEEEIAEAVQITFDESIDLTEKSDEKYAETELYVTENDSTSEEEEESEDTSDFIQQTILFPGECENQTESFEENEENVTVAENPDQDDSN